MPLFTKTSRIKTGVEFACGIYIVGNILVWKILHEVRDPIHVFVRLDTDERRVLDSRAVQRLRHIQQLALSCNVYPGATHKRFEHSLGVMELATRIFDVITQDRSDPIVKRLPELTQ